MEAFRDRTIKIDVPYNLAVSDEVRIYRRQFRSEGLSGCSIAPHTLEMAALWAVLTRLEDPTHPSLSLLQKARLYDGQAVQGFGPEHVREMREAAEREGLSGISPRYVQDRIATALVSGRPVVGPLDVLDAIAEGLAHHSLVSNEDTRRRYVQLVGQVREEYEEVVKREVQEAIASDRDALERLCAKYLDNVRAYTTREKVLDAGGAPADPDERLMRSIEEKVDISEGRKDDFRHELMNFISSVEAEGRTFDWTRNRRLARALELKVFEDRRDSIQLTSLVSTVVDPDVQARIAVIRERLMRRFGYDELSADEVLQHVAGLFARGEAKDEELEAA
jgi:serine protein kinase